ncbi:MAG: hypothetical protein NT074_03350 [Methanomicrobiales archaeon]|nr:hypothetical protein [Methanomicrobiales archaeon]
MPPRKRKNDYPEKSVKNDMPVFITEHQTALTLGLTMQLNRLAKRSDIQMHIKPQIFRHSHIIHLIKENVSESVIKLMIWSSLTKNMFRPKLISRARTSITRPCGITGSRRPKMEKF